MLRLYPNAYGTAIDTWKNYNENDIEIIKYIEENNIERVFYENIKKANMSDRIIVFKGDSVNILIKLVEAKQRFDFIYVDGSHKCLDCYTDMVLAWHLLSKGGVLAVDDILYGYNRVIAGDILSYPLMAKYHFMEKFIGQYEVLSDSYRLFIQKL